MSGDGGFPGVRSLFGGKGFPGKVRLARKGQAGDDAASGAAQPQLEGSCDDPGAAGAAQELGDLSLNGGGGGGGGGRRMEAVSSDGPPAAPSGSGSGGASRRTSSSQSGEAAAAAATAAGGGSSPPADAAIRPQRDGVQVAALRSMSDTRIAKFKRLLDVQVVDLEALRELTWSGIPVALRPTCWRLLLGYLPPNRERRAQILTRKRREYRDTMVPDYYDLAASGVDQMGEELGALRQVAVDVPRTAPGVAFFHTPQIQKSLERILYIWGIRHPASGYVQGINDLVTPFMAVFLSEHLEGPMEGWSPEECGEGLLLDIEADCYWCLCKLLDGIQDHYTYAQPGIQRALFHTQELVRRVEEPVAAHLEKEGLQFIQFAFRWVNCLLLREVPFPLAIRLWDTYLSEGSQLKDFLAYTLAAFLLSWSSQLQTLEFQELIMFLQRPPTSGWGEKDIELVLSRAYMWRASFKGAASHFS
ncbi:GTPase-activating gyp1 [Micractinium conductrix]|uniref:GTPase-activating gyp1 n=1 Tax=Micractinium conductrix TaxID=554055 RepID=A0A2P6VJS7_9CHLO|nr:GTPase-activating gyp1 [Micractinium conductrix]|eukprot:PSC74343.1 GTPase-activating gyp1 [Micractinium conductrix]